MIDLRKRLYYLVFAIVVYTICNIIFYQYTLGPTLKYVVVAQLLSMVLVIVFDVLWDHYL